MCKICDYTEENDGFNNIQSKEYASPFGKTWLDVSIQVPYEVEDADEDDEDDYYNPTIYVNYFLDGAENNPGMTIPINFCPMCGRKLR